MMTIGLAYAHLNLRWNPFGDVGGEDLARLAVVQVDQYVDRLKRPGFALQFLGESGRGKTTHMLALRQYFPLAPYFHFADNAPIPKIPYAPLIFLDETQRLPGKLRKHIFSWKASFVVATHVDHSIEIEQAGLEYVSITIHGLSISKLKPIIERRIEWARRGPGPVPRVPETAMAYLVEKYGDDLSAILARLYDEIQVLKEVSDVKIPASSSV